VNGFIKESEIGMYIVKKDSGRMVVTDTTTDKVIYSAPEDAYIVVKKGGTVPSVETQKVGTLTDIQLLMALANCQRLLP
jgi:hypothetical protein